LAQARFRETGRFGVQEEGKFLGKHDANAAEDEGCVDDEVSKCPGFGDG